MEKSPNPISDSSAEGCTTKLKFSHSRKYEETINLNASNIIQGLIESIDEDLNCNCQQN